MDGPPDGQTKPFKFTTKKNEELSRSSDQMRNVQAVLFNSSVMCVCEEKESRELEGKVQDAIRKDRQSAEFNVDVESVMKKSIVRTGQNDSVETELKKLIHSEINNYLMGNVT